jgi:hypothetical protein
MLYKRASCIEKEVTTFLIVVEVNYPQKVEATVAPLDAASTPPCDSSRQLAYGHKGDGIKTIG